MSLSCIYNNLPVSRVYVMQISQIIMLSSECDWVASFTCRHAICLKESLSFYWYYIVLLILYCFTVCQWFDSEVFYLLAVYCLADRVNLIIFHCQYWFIGIDLPTQVRKWKQFFHYISFVGGRYICGWQTATTSVMFYIVPLLHKSALYT